MPEPKWTPGPWGRNVTRREPVYAGSRPDWKYIAFEAQDKGISDAEAMANLRLIAAAPELYEALAAILASDGLNSDNAARARAAIAKAEGRS